MSLDFNVIPVETDVLIIGGGLAGCMAAIKAREGDVSVTIAEKANTIRSGCAGTGVDHTWGYCPPVHQKMGWTIEDLMEDHDQKHARGLLDKSLLYLVASTMYDRLQDMEKFGINFRYDDSKAPGKFRLVYQFHSQPTSYNFDGRDMKVKLTQEARRRGVDIVNRVMVTDLLTADGHVSGAVGVSTRDKNIYLFKAKAVILSTGRVHRLSRNQSGIMFNLRSHPLSGDGKAMALRAGLDLINMEFLTPERFQIGFYQTAGGAPGSSYQPGFRLIDQQGKVLMPRIQFYDWENLGKEKVNAAEARKNWLEDGVRNRPPTLEEWRQGGGPYYLDGSQATEEEVQYAEWALSHEGKCWQFLRHLEEEGVDLRKDMLEFALHDRENAGTAAAGVVVGKDLETGIKGLYAAGDEVGGLPWSSCPGALTMGWYAGDMAAAQARSQTRFLPVTEEKVAALRESCADIYHAGDGYHWKEVQLALQTIMDYYCYNVRSAPMLDRGLERLQELRKAPLSATNPHELFRCLEMKSMIESAEMTMRASLCREESRRVPTFRRADFPEQDDKNWLAFAAVSHKDGRFSVARLPVEKEVWRPR